MTKKKSIILSVICLSCFSGLNAQSSQQQIPNIESRITDDNVLILTLEEIFSLADTNSKSLNIHSLTVDKAEQSIDIARNELLPSVESKLNGRYISNGISFSREFDNGSIAEMPHFGNSFILKATQAIYSGGRIKNNIDLKRLEKKSAEEEERYNRQNIRFLLAGYYLEISKLSNEKYVYESNIKQTELLVKDMQAAYQQGTALKSDITRYELQLQNLKLDLTSIRNRMNVIGFKLASTIGIDTDIKIMTDTAYLFKQNIDNRDRELWLSNKNETPQIRKADIDIKISENKIEDIKGEYRPNIKVMAAGEMNGPNLSEVPPINSNFAYWYAGIEVSYNLDILFKGKKKMKHAKINQMKLIQQKELALEELENDVYEAHKGLEEAYERMHTRLKSVQLAHENYDIVRQRYLNGLSLITDMLDAGNTQLDTELQLANDRINIIYQYFLLKKITGTL